MSSADIFSMLQSISDRLTNIESSLGTVPGKAASGASSAGSSDGSTGSNAEELSRSIKSFDTYCDTFLTPFVAACDKLGGDAQKGGYIIKAAWTEMRSFLLMASKCKEPAQTALPGHLAGIASKMKELSGAIQRNEWEKHMKTLSEGASCLNWLMIKPAPRDFIESYIGGSDYWANNIRKEFRTTNPDQMSFCDTFKVLLIELMAYVKEHHSTGVAWNAQGIDASTYDASAVSSSTPSSAAPVVSPAAATVSKDGSGVALFAALNKGGAITSGLKTVTKDMQTWRSEYKGGDAPMPIPVAPVVTKRPTADVVKGPPKLEFQAATSKWVVENQTDAGGVLEVKVTDKKESVYIYGCVGATISIMGKCKSIVVDGCKKTKVLFDTAMASCEVVNCQRMQIQCREKVAAVAIDKTDGIIVFLPTSSLDTEIVASKSSEMNLSWPDANGDLIEKPIPEQYKHRVKGNGVTAEISDLYTH